MLAYVREACLAGYGSEPSSGLASGNYPLACGRRRSRQLDAGSTRGVATTAATPGAGDARELRPPWPSVPGNFRRRPRRHSPASRHALRRLAAAPAALLLLACITTAAASANSGSVIRAPRPTAATTEGPIPNPSTPMQQAGPFGTAFAAHLHPSSVASSSEAGTAAALPLAANPASSPLLPLPLRTGRQQRRLLQRSPPVKDSKHTGSGRDRQPGPAPRPCPVLQQLPPPLLGQQGLRSCPLVVSFLVLPQDDAQRHGGGGSAAATNSSSSSSNGSSSSSSGSSSSAGGEAAAEEPPDGAPLCAAGVVVNNGPEELYGWQLVWRFSEHLVYRAGDVGGAVLITTGASAPVRVVNSGEVTSIGPSGGTANFTLSILPNISTNASSSNSSNSTPAWAVTPLDWTSVFVNGQRCVALPSRSLGLPGCGLSYSDLAAGGGAGAPGTESATVTTDRGGEAVPLACASVFCCGDLDRGGTGTGFGAEPVSPAPDVAATPSEATGSAPAANTTGPSSDRQPSLSIAPLGAPAGAEPDILSAQLSTVLGQLVTLARALLPPAFPPVPSSGSLGQDNITAPNSTNNSTGAETRSANVTDSVKAGDNSTDGSGGAPGGKLGAGNTTSTHISPDVGNATEPWLGGGGADGDSSGALLLTPQVAARLTELLAAAASGADVTGELLATLQEIVRQNGGTMDHSLVDLANGTSPTGNGTFPPSHDPLDIAATLHNLSKAIASYAPRPAPGGNATAPPPPSAPPPPPPPPNSTHPGMQQAADPSVPFPSQSPGAARGPQPDASGPGATQAAPTSSSPGNLGAVTPAAQNGSAAGGSDLPAAPDGSGDSGGAANGTQSAADGVSSVETDGDVAASGTDGPVGGPVGVVVGMEAGGGGSGTGTGPGGGGGSSSTGGKSGHSAAVPAAVAAAVGAVVAVVMALAVFAIRRRRARAMQAAGGCDGDLRSKPSAAATGASSGEESVSSGSGDGGGGGGGGGFAGGPWGPSASLHATTLGAAGAAATSGYADNNECQGCEELPAQRPGGQKGPRRPPAHAAEVAVVLEERDGEVCDAQWTSRGTDQDGNNKEGKKNVGSGGVDAAGEVEEEGAATGVSTGPGGNTAVRVSVVAAIRTGSGGMGTWGTGDVGCLGWLMQRSSGGAAGNARTQTAATLTSAAAAEGVGRASGAEGAPPAGASPPPAGAASGLTASISSRHSGGSRKGGNRSGSSARSSSEGVGQALGHEGTRPRAVGQATDVEEEVDSEAPSGLHLSRRARHLRSPSVGVSGMTLGALLSAGGLSGGAAAAAVAAAAAAAASSSPARAAVMVESVVAGEHFGDVTASWTPEIVPLSPPGEDPAPGTRAVGFGPAASATDLAHPQQQQQRPRPYPAGPLHRAWSDVPRVLGPGPFQRDPPGIDGDGRVAALWTPLSELPATATAANPGAIAPRPPLAPGTALRRVQPTGLPAVRPVNRTPGQGGLHPARSSPASLLTDWAAPSAAAPWAATAAAAAVSSEESSAHSTPEAAEAGSAGPAVHMGGGVGRHGVRGSALHAPGGSLRDSTHLLSRPGSVRLAPDDAAERGMPSAFSAAAAAAAAPAGGRSSITGGYPNASLAGPTPVPVLSEPQQAIQLQQQRNPKRLNSLPAAPPAAAPPPYLPPSRSLPPPPTLAPPPHQLHPGAQSPFLQPPRSEHPLSPARASSAALVTPSATRSFPVTAGSYAKVPEGNPLLLSGGARPVDIPAPARPRAAPAPAGPHTPDMPDAVRPGQWQDSTGVSAQAQGQGGQWHGSSAMVAVGAAGAVGHRHSAPSGAAAALREQAAWVDIDFARDVVLERRLGSGAHGTVFAAWWVGRAVAVKVVALLEADGGGVCAHAVESIRQEVQLLSRLRHPHIVQFHGACLAPPHVCIVEELATGGSLHARLHAKRRGVKVYPPLTYTQVLRLGIEVAGAMAYLHPHVVHRDLKPQNVLLDGEGRAKVCDFGIAKIKDTTFMSTRNAQAGTPAYMAPEQFEGRPVTEKVDVYAFAMSLWECLTGQQPWADLHNPMQVIFVVGVQCQRPPLPPGCPPALAGLVARCWAEDPAARPPFPEIVAVLQAELHRVERAAGEQRPIEAAQPRRQS